MARSLPLGAIASDLLVSNFRHENWRMGSPPPLIVNPQADLHALLSHAWGEAADVDEIVRAFLEDEGATAQSLASILYSRVPVLLALLEFLAEKSFKGEIQ